MTVRKQRERIDSREHCTVYLQYWQPPPGPFPFHSPSSFLLHPQVPLSMALRRCPYQRQDRSRLRQAREEDLSPCLFDNKSVNMGGAWSDSHWLSFAPLFS